jgi:nicotinamidase-related amidase
MKKAYGLDIPVSREGVCHPDCMALLVYDMQVGIVRQALNAQQVTSNVVSVVTAARQGGYHIFFSRHLSLPNQAAGVSQLRTAMAWQRKDRAEETKPGFPRDPPQAQIIPEVMPLESEVILEKLGMSFFVGTPLEMALRDCGVSAIAIFGVVLEIGIEPTVRHAADLGFLPVVVEDGCGSINEQARKRSLDAFAFGSSCIVTDSATFCEQIVRSGE